jgi:hypothetical protein
MKLGNSNAIEKNIPSFITPSKIMLVIVICLGVSSISLLVLSKIRDNPIGIWSKDS